MLPIAVVIPSYNAERFLATALDSVLAQTRPASRIVVVDDGSTDGTVALAESYAARGLPVACVRTPVNGGPGTARNLGVQATTEPLIAFLDADDCWDPTHCATLGPLLDRHPEAVLAYGAARTIGGTAPGPEIRMPPAEPTDASWALVYDNVIVQSAALVRRDAFVRAGGYRDGMRYAEDYDLWLRVAELGPVVASGQTTCNRLLHEGQATTQQGMKMHWGAWAARLRTRERRAARLAPAEMARLDQLLAAAFERDLGWAWHSRRRAPVREVLTIADGVPCLAPVVRRWERRLQLYWPLWRVAAGLWDALPASLLTSLRNLRRRRAAAADLASIGGRV